MSKYHDAQKGFEEGTEAKKRPLCVTDEHLQFLDELRESGVTNMLGACPYLMDEFPGLDDEQSATVLAYWMKSFGDPNR